MLRCKQCGSTKFTFTYGRQVGGHHGARCANCGKVLTRRDARALLPALTDDFATSVQRGRTENAPKSR